MWARWLNVILGFWLVSAPFVLDYRLREAQLHDLVLGLAILLVALLSIAMPRLRFAHTALGAWLVAAPFALGYSDSAAATLNDVIVGLLVALLSLVWDHRVWTPHRRPLTGS
jgi:hypothetical protein